MRETMQFSRVESIIFEVNIGDMFDLLRKNGKIPDGFVIDHVQSGDFPIELRVNRSGPAPSPTMSCVPADGTSP